MKLSVEKLVKITGGTLITNAKSNCEFGISTDTRTIQETELFLPLKGETFDGHDFINTAIEKGCGGFFTEKELSEVIQKEYKGCIIKVDSALEAYLKVARYARREIAPTLIAVTGSAGKTTSKEFISCILSTTFNTHKSALNHNNEIGLCKTLLSMPKDTQYAVIEMGMRGFGEIELLSKYSEPDIAVITNVGTAHIGRLGSIENIAAAKCEITSSLKKDGLFLAYDDDLIRKSNTWKGETLFYGTDVKITKQEEGLTGFVYKGEYYEIPVMGEYNVINALPAVEIGQRAGISYENIKKGLMNYVPIGDRGKIITLKNGAKAIMDCYNANPDSVIASVDSLIKTYKGAKIMLVLGDMEELGEQEEPLHRKVGEFIAKQPVHTLVTVGKKAMATANSADNGLIRINALNNKEEAVDFLLNNIESDCVILFKASRAVKLEDVLTGLQADTAKFRSLQK